MICFDQTQSPAGTLEQPVKLNIRSTPDALINSIRLIRTLHTFLGLFAALNAFALAEGPPKNNDG